jgi:hypothetical protein
MDTLYMQINNVLAEWNPIGVPQYIVNEEYTGYIPVIVRHLNSREELFCCLEDILTNQMGILFDKESKTDAKDLLTICDKLIKIGKSRRNV